MVPPILGATLIPVESRQATSRGPVLYASGRGERHATWLELFFDLVFVLAIAELAGYLHDHLTPAGFLGFALLSLPVWLVWSNFSYFADLFDVEGPLYRVATLAAMLASIALAVSVHDALDGGSAGFAAAYAALRVLLIVLYAWAWRRVEETRPLAARQLAGFSAGAAIWSASLLVPEPARYWLWAAGLGVDVAARPVLVAVLGFVSVSCLWWLYFDRVLDHSAVARAFTRGRRELFVGFAWAYGHLGLWLGLAATAVGIELAIPAASEPALPAGARAALCGGVALSLVAVTVLQRTQPPALPGSAALIRVGVAAAAAGLALGAGALSPVALLGLLGIALVGLTVSEVVRAARSGGPRPGATGQP